MLGAASGMYRSADSVRLAIADFCLPIQSNKHTIVEQNINAVLDFDTTTCSPMVIPFLQQRRLRLLTAVPTRLQRRWCLIRCLKILPSSRLTPEYYGTFFTDKTRQSMQWRESRISTPLSLLDRKQPVCSTASPHLIRCALAIPRFFDPAPSRSASELFESGVKSNTITSRIST